MPRPLSIRRALTIALTHWLAHARDMRTGDPRLTYERDKAAKFALADSHGTDFAIVLRNLGFVVTPLKAPERKPRSKAKR